jgi:hypothetical protein
MDRLERNAQGPVRDRDTFRQTVEEQNQELATF